MTKRGFAKNLRGALSHNIEKTVGEGDIVSQLTVNPD